MAERSLRVRVVFCLIPSWISPYGTNIGGRVKTISSSGLEAGPNISLATVLHGMLRFSSPDQIGKKDSKKKINVVSDGVAHCREDE